MPGPTPVMERFFRRFVNLIEWWSVLLLGVMVVVVCGGVFFRYALKSSLVWYDEFASYLLVWLTFYGTVVAHYHRRHISFDLVVNRFSPKLRQSIDFIGECFVLLFQWVLFYYGWVLTDRMGGETAVSLPWVKMSWINSVLPITGGLMLAISIDRLVRIASGEEKTKGGAAWSGSSSE